jgi:hypothetical protein
MVTADEIGTIAIFAGLDVKAGERLARGGRERPFRRDLDQFADRL